MNSPIPLTRAERNAEQVHFVGNLFQRLVSYMRLSAERSDKGLICQLDRLSQVSRLLSKLYELFLIDEDAPTLKKILPLERLVETIAGVVGASYRGELPADKTIGGGAGMVLSLILCEQSRVLSLQGEVNPEITLSVNAEGEILVCVSGLAAQRDSWNQELMVAEKLAAVEFKQKIDLSWVEGRCVFKLIIQS